MKELPKEVSAYKKTNVFSQEDIPAGLLKDHQTKKDTWGLITVVEGEVLYVLGDEEILLTPEKFGVIEPEVHHHVKKVGPVKFYVEFYK